MAATRHNDWQHRHPMMPTNDAAAFWAAVGDATVVAQPKYDGIRLTVAVTTNKVHVLTRNKNRLTGLDHLTQDLRALARELQLLEVVRARETVVVDAELMARDGTQQPYLRIFDLWSEGPFYRRHLALVNAIPAIAPQQAEDSRLLRWVPCELHEPQRIHDSLQALAQQARAADPTVEGVVLKGFHSPYVFGESPHWLRVVPQVTYDLAVVGSEVDRAGQLTALLCRHGDHVVRVGSGFTHQERAAFAVQRPAVVEVHRRDCHAGGSQMPYVFRRVRTDKARVD